MWIIRQGEVPTPDKLLRLVNVRDDVDRGIELLDVVALTEDLAGRGLRRGQVGTVVECLAKDVFEVEFSDDQGRTYATVALRAGQLMVLHYQPSQAA